jgi:hypothetical protein
VPDYVKAFRKKGYARYNFFLEKRAVGAGRFKGYPALEEKFGHTFRELFGPNKVDYLFLYNSIEFRAFLERRFKRANPDPSEEMRLAFESILSYFQVR